MKERPIIFSGPMVRAILEGRKTQTRRVINRLVGFGSVTHFRKSELSGYDWTFRDKRSLWNDISQERLMESCPLGQPGDVLWVREAHAWANHLADGYDVEDPTCVAYKADHKACYRYNDKSKPDYLDTYAWDFDGLKWRPSIHMPRWASRIDLRIKSVRIERLQDISEQDAMAEGIESGVASAPAPLHCETLYCAPGVIHTNVYGDKSDCALAYRSARAAFCVLWDSINSKISYSWESNPWVWVYEFGREDAK